MDNQRLNEITRDLAEADRKIKGLEKEREVLRAEFFEIAAERARDELGLSQRVITVPSSFFAATKMPADEFVSSRFPGWELREQLNEHDAITFVLREDADYKGWSYTNPTTLDVVSKQIQTPKAELDQKTLKLEQPELWDAVMKPVTTYEVDVEEMQKAIAKDPSNREVFFRHTRYLKSPIKKLGPMRKAKADE